MVLLGIVRKELGFSFLGETRQEDHLIVSDAIIDGLDLEVGVYCNFACSRSELLRQHIHMWTQGTGT
jgi:hypothetical protein